MKTYSSPLHTKNSKTKSHKRVDKSRTLVDSDNDLDGGSDFNIDDFTKSPNTHDKQAHLKSPCNNHKAKGTVKSPSRQRDKKTQSKSFSKSIFYSCQDK